MQDEELAYGLRSVAGPVTGAGRPASSPGSTSRSRRATGRPSGSCASCSRPLLETCARDLGAAGRRSVPSRDAARLPKLLPASLDDDQRARVRRDRRWPARAGPQLFRLVDDDGRLEGPFNAFLLQPRLGMALQAARQSPSATRPRCRPCPGGRDPGRRRRARDSAFELARARGGGPPRRTHRRRAGGRARRAATTSCRRTSGLVAGTARQLLADAATSTTRATRDAVDALGRCRAVRAAHPRRLLRALALQLRVFRVPGTTGLTLPDARDML